MPPSILANMVSVNTNNEPVRTEMMIVIEKAGYCNNRVSNNGFLWIAPRINNTAADTQATISDTRIFGWLMPWYCCRYMKTNKIEIINMEKGIRLTQSSSISSLFSLTGTKKESCDYHKKQYRQAQVIIELPSKIFNECATGKHAYS